MALEDIRRLIQADFDGVDREIRAQLTSDVVLINQLGHYIINSGGKRLRPMLVLLAAGAAGYRGRQHIPLAAIIEFIHTATLLHDDVVDSSNLRRGRETANALWGNEASVLVGDFLYSRAFQMMVDVDSMRVMQIMADATNTIAEGEVMQLLNCHEPDTTEEQYLGVIHRKTAKLFEAGAQAAAVLAASDRETESALGRYGMHLGTAFQLVDDAMDYSASAEEMGKNVGDDLAEGKPTLPLIHVMKHGTPGQSRMVADAIREGGLDHLEEIGASIRENGALEYTLERAESEGRAALDALEALPAGRYRDALEELVGIAIHRRR